MHSSKDFFLSAIGVVLPSELMEYDVFIRGNEDTQPSFGIIHRTDGTIILRVNPWEYDGIVITI